MLIKLQITSGAYYCDDENYDKDVIDFILAEYYEFDQKIPEEMLSRIFMRIVDIRGDWFSVDIQSSDDYMTYTVSLRSLVEGLFSFSNHDALLFEAKTTAEKINSLFAEAFAPIHYTTKKLPIEPFNTFDIEVEDQFIFLKQVDCDSLEGNPLLNELMGHGYSYSEINVEHSISNAGASSGFIASLIWVAGKMSGGVLSAIGKSTFEKIIDKYRLEFGHFYFDSIKINLKKLKKEIARYTNIPESIIKLHKIENKGINLNVTFVYLNGLSVVVIETSCTLDGHFISIEVTEAEA